METIVSVCWTPSLTRTFNRYESLVSRSNTSINLRTPLILSNSKCLSSLASISSNCNAPSLSGSVALIVPIDWPGLKSSDTLNVIGSSENTGGLSFLSSISILTWNYTATKKLKIIIGYTCMFVYVVRWMGEKKTQAQNNAFQYDHWLVITN